MVREMKLSELDEEIERVFKPRGEAIGFALLKSKDELSVAPFDRSIALCQAFKLSSIYEVGAKFDENNIDSCCVGTYVLGFSEPPAELADIWVKNYKYSEERFSELAQNIYSLPQGKYEAAVFAPLKDFDSTGIKPDGIIMIGNTNHAYLFASSYFDATGKKIESDFNGHAACEIVAKVAEGKPWITIPCGGARGIAGSQDDELWIGASVEDFETSVSRLKEIGLKYPPAIYQSAVAPMVEDHLLTKLISRPAREER